MAIRGGDRPDRHPRHDSERDGRLARRQDRRRRRSATPIPAGAEVVDASGRFVSPGIIDAHSHIAAESINEGGTTVSSMTGIEDVLDPTDVNIFRDLAGGLTVANVLHGSANPIGGKNAVIKLRWGKTRPSELLFEGAMPGIKFALGENPKDMRRGRRPAAAPRRYPATRPGVELRDSRRVHARQGVSTRMAGLRTTPRRRGERPDCRRAEICSSSRWSRSSKASVSCTRTAIAPTRS